jgi:predicted phosphoribosyltransferase
MTSTRYRDRVEAGQRLATDLREYVGKKDIVVLGIPRGGVILGYEVAVALGAPLDVVVPRKIGAPGNPEFAVGAVTEDGTTVLNRETLNMLGITERQLKKTIDDEVAEVKRRVKTYRGGEDPVSLTGKTAIIVDDGLATGATMKAAVAATKGREASRIIVAVPVAPPEAVKELSKHVDEVICPLVYEPFFAIGQFYDDFSQVDDEQVITLLRLAREKTRNAQVHS